LLLVVAFSVQVVDAATLQSLETGRNAERATAIEASRRYAAAVRRQREQPGVVVLRLGACGSRCSDECGQRGVIERGAPTSRMAVSLLALPPPVALVATRLMSLRA